MHNVMEDFMRTTIDLPENLVKEAMKACKVSTKTGVIILALKDLIRKSKISDLKNQLEKAQSQGFIEITNQAIRPTKLGQQYLNDCLGIFT